MALSFKQREKTYSCESFALNVSGPSIRLLSAIACECHLDLWKRILDLMIFPVKQASRESHVHLLTRVKNLGLQQCMTGVSIFRLIDDGRVLQSFTSTICCSTKR